VKKPLPDEYNAKISPEDHLYIIGIVSEMVGIPIWTLRELDEMGIVEPKRLGKKTRCYSQVQIKKLCYVNYLMNEKNVNISGIKVILDIETE